MRGLKDNERVYGEDIVNVWVVRGMILLFILFPLIACLSMLFYEK